MIESITNEDILKEFISKIKCSDGNITFNIDKYKDNIEDILKCIIECLYNDIKFEYNDSTRFKCSIDTVEKLVEIFKNRKEIIAYNIVRNKLIENNHRLNNHIISLLQQKLSCGIKLKYDNELLRTPENLVNIFTQKGSTSKEVIIIEIIKQNKNLLPEIYNNIFGIIELKTQECINILIINIKEIKNKKYNQTVEGFFLDIKKTLQQWNELVKQQQLEELYRLILEQQQLKNQIPKEELKQYNELLIRSKKLNSEKQLFRPTK